MDFKCKFFSILEVIFRLFWGHFDHFYGHKYGFEGMYELDWTRRVSWNDKKNFWNFLPKNSKNHFFIADLSF